MTSETYSPENIQKQPSNNVDDEFDSLESDFNFSERMDIARDIFEELYNLDSTFYMNSEFRGMIKAETANGENGVKHFLLPSFPSKEEVNKIKESYGSRANYLTSEKRMFLKLGQGEMWSIPKNENPYVKVSMSECSLLVAEDDENLHIAHISFSETHQIEATLEFLESRGIDREDILAIASTGDIQVKNNEKGYESRAVNKDDYLRLGLLPENIMQFEYSLGEQIDKDTRIVKNITQALITREGIMKWSQDIKKTSIAGSIFPREERFGDYKDQEIRKF